VLDDELAVRDVTQDAVGVGDELGRIDALGRGDTQHVRPVQVRQVVLEERLPVAELLDPGRGPGARAALEGERARAVRQSSSPPARRITIWSSSTVTSTGRWPAQCSA